MCVGMFEGRLGGLQYTARTKEKKGCYPGALHPEWVGRKGTSKGLTEIKMNFNISRFIVVGA